jgi:hypothetical protein
MNKYLGIFHYGATGEGVRSYYRLVSAETKEEALDKFVVKAAEKWYGPKEQCDKVGPDFYQHGLDFCKMGARVVKVEDITKDDLYHLNGGTITAIQDLCEQSGMIEGDFEFWFQYNLS